MYMQYREKICIFKPHACYVHTYKKKMNEPLIWIRSFYIFMSIRLFFQVRSFYIEGGGMHPTYL